MAIIRQAKPGDLPAISQILGNASLPFSDITLTHLSDFLVVEKDQAIVGCVGIERYGDTALLRSLAVDASRQGTGQGRHLVQAVEEHAAHSGVSRLFLLTGSASGFFEDRGYHRIERSAAPPAMQQSTQFAELCPASAECMEKNLTLPPRAAG